MTDEPITKVSQTLTRQDGSQVRIEVESMTGRGLTSSTDIRVHRRKTPDSPWQALSHQPHPDWIAMSVEEYTRHGRSEVLQHVAPIEILRLSNALGRPMSYLNTL